MTHRQNALESNLRHLNKMLEVGSRWVEFLQQTEPESLFTQKEVYRLRLINQSIRDCQYRIGDPRKREFVIEYYATLSDYHKGIKSEAKVLSNSLIQARKTLRKRLGRIHITDKPYL